MAAECATTAITRMARLLGVSTSGYYKRVKRSVTTQLTDREQRKADLTVKIIDHHRDSGGTYGSPRITADLRASGEQVSERTVAKIMAEIGLAGISPRILRKKWSSSSMRQALDRLVGTKPLPLPAGVAVAVAFISAEVAVVSWFQHLGSERSFRGLFFSV